MAILAAIADILLPTSWGRVCNIVAVCDLVLALSLLTWKRREACMMCATTYSVLCSACYYDVGERAYH